MEGSDGSPPSSLWMIHAAELFPKPPMEKEDDQLTVPFQELAGESVKYLGRTDDGVLALSNYRLFLLKNSTYSETSVPLGLIESAQTRDLFHLLINCKDASTVKCSFETAEQCSEWQRRITLSVGVPETLESLFAFPFYSWTCDSQQLQQQQQQQHQPQPQQHQQNQHHNHHHQHQHHTTNGSNGIGGSNGSGGGGSGVTGEVNIGSEWSGRLQRAGRFEDNFRKEAERLQFDLNGVWRISNANEDFKLCPSYPPLILVPCCISDDTLQHVANFRGSRRLPAVVWRHKQSGAIIARSSQPEVGWLGWRNSKDEQLLKALADACAFDRGEQSRRQNLCTSGESTPSSADGSHEEVCMDEIRKILIVDARSYTSAVTNRARGGGCECIEYYPCAEIEFMNLGNIHAIRKSFHALRQLCASPPDVPNWLGLLERTMWLQHLSGLLAASMTVCHAIEKKGRPVLVHCSDGWDRTPQIVATAELCLDPYYRTVEGFRVLVEREWLNFGHKFADRCGHGPGSDELNERCPVFLQWLDIVHQIHRQFTCSFEFSMAYLIKLAQHSHSCLFGTFLCNSLKERIDNTVMERTFSVWPFLSGSIYKNPLYVPNKEKVLWPAHNVRDLVLWSEVYLGSLGNQNSSDCLSNASDVNNQGSTSPMTKTRSYGDLMTVGGIQNGLTRRSSDPNMIVESHLMIPINNHSDNNSSMDASSDHDDDDDIDIDDNSGGGGGVGDRGGGRRSVGVNNIPDIISNTTEKLQNLTNELNQSDEEICKINSIDIVDDYDNDDDDNCCRNQQNNIIGSLLLPTTTKTTTIHTKSIKDENIKKQLENLENNLLELKSKKYFNNNSSLVEKNEIIIENGNNIRNNSSCSSNDNNTLIPMVKTTTTTATSKTTIFDEIITTDNHDNIDDRRNFSEFIDVIDGQQPKYQQQQQQQLLQQQNNHEMLESVDLKDFNSISSSSPTVLLNTSFETQNLWHGSINTSTDTLVPIEPQYQQLQKTSFKHNDIENINNDDEDDDGVGVGVDVCDDQEVPIIATGEILTNYSNNSHSSLVDENTNTLNSQKKITSNILPEVHCKIMMNNIQQNNLKTTATTTKLNNLNLNNANNLTNTNDLISTTTTATTINNIIPSSSTFTTTATMHIIENDHHINDINEDGRREGREENELEDASNNIGGGFINCMDESILILPEHQKLEISSSGKCETITTSNSQNSMQNYSISSLATTVTTTTSGNGTGGGVIGTTTQYRRRRTSSSNSKIEQNCNFSKNIGGSATNSRFSTPGIRSLPLTPPGGSSSSTDRVPVSIQCPDGLAHALSEQNIRLQQIVYEHKLREDALLRELHGMRMALLKKTCPHCNNQSLINDEQNSVLDNIENLSICSWEAVEDRSGPSSGASSTQPPQTSQIGTGNSVLWVPDHAVTRCTGCQTEFWLGRRRHHCRSCGQIFCADCSEYWAPLPDARLYTPVRLCGPCYQNVMIGIQQQQHSMTTTQTSTTNSSLMLKQQQQHQHQQYSSSTTLSLPSASSSTTTSSSSSLPTTNPLTMTATTNAHHLSAVAATTISTVISSSSNNYTRSSNIATAAVASTTTTPTTSSTTATATKTTMEACKHAANPSINDRGTYKATAASN